MKVIDVGFRCFVSVRCHAGGDKYVIGSVLAYLASESEPVARPYTEQLLTSGMVDVHVEVRV